MLKVPDKHGRKLERPTCGPVRTRTESGTGPEPSRAEPSRGAEPGWKRATTTAGTEHRHVRAAAERIRTHRSVSDGSHGDFCPTRTRIIKLLNTFN